MRFRFTLVVAIVALAALVGCGSGSKKHVAGSGPTPNRLPQIDVNQAQAGPGSPGAVVVKLWGYVRDGLYPLAVNAFDPQAVAAVGRDNLLGGLNIAQGTVNAYAPVVQKTITPKLRPGAKKSNETLAIVYVQGKGTSGATTRVQFVLRKSPAGWGIVYDTMLDGAIRGYVTTARQNAIQAAKRLPAAVATRAGAIVSEHYAQNAADLAKGYF